MSLLSQMIDSPLKRQREEDFLPLPWQLPEHCFGETGDKRQKLSFLNQEGDDDNNNDDDDLSSFLSAFQEELSSGDFPLEVPDSSSSSAASVDDYDYTCSSSSSFDSKLEEEEEERERVIRHLLEASDDELGIPTAGDAAAAAEAAAAAADAAFEFNDGLWEFEDVNANYYTMLQSELLFM